MKRIPAAIFLYLLTFALHAQTDLERHFNLCLEFGAPMEVVELYQSFRTYKGETNGTVSYVAKEDNSLLRDKPFSEYQIWYTIDKDHGLYQSSLLLRGDKPALQQVLTEYLHKFTGLYGEPVYTNLSNGSLLIFWYNEATWTVEARLILDIVNPYKFVSITYCSPQMKHTYLLKTLYGSDGLEPEMENTKQAQKAEGTAEKESPAEAPPKEAEETPSLGDSALDNFDSGGTGKTES
jgi:hypothetical protein